MHVFLLFICVTLDVQKTLWRETKTVANLAQSPTYMDRLASVHFSSKLSLCMNWRFAVFYMCSDLVSAVCFPKLAPLGLIGQLDI